PVAPRRFPSPAFECVTEGTRLLIAQKPSDLRNAHALLEKILSRKPQAKVLQDFDKACSFFLQPAAQGSQAYTERFSNLLDCPFGVRQQRRDRIFDFRRPAVLFGAPGLKDIFAIAPEQRVKIWVGVRYRGTANIGRKDDLILSRAKFDLAAKICPEK